MAHEPRISGPGQEVEMARATANGVSMELTTQEASVLLAVLRNIGGIPGPSRRALDEVATALRDAGVSPAGTHVTVPMQLEAHT